MLDTYETSVIAAKCKCYCSIWGKVGILLSAIILFVALGFVTPASAASDIPWNSSMVYNVTVNKIEIYNNTTGSWYTLSSSSHTFNIASASAGATVGSWVSGVVPPNGEYTKSRVIVDNTFGLKACYTDTGTTYCTNGTTFTASGDTFSNVSTGSYSTATTTSTVVDFTTKTLSTGQEALSDGTIRVTNTFVTPITVSAGSPASSMSISFDVNNVLQYYPPNDLAAGSPRSIGSGQPSVSIN